MVSRIIALVRRWRRRVDVPRPPARRVAPRAVWFWTAAAAVVFALGVPAQAVLGSVGHLFFLVHLLAVGYPALRLGRRGAWGGALLSVGAFAATAVTSGLLDGRITDLSSDIAIVAGTSVILGLMLGEMGEALASQRRLAGRLADSESRFHDLFNSLPMGFLITDRHGRVEMANRAAGRLLEREAADLAGTCVSDFVPSDHWSYLRTGFLQPTADLPVPALLHGSGRRSEWVWSTHVSPDGPRTLAFFWDAEEKIRAEEEASTLAAAVKSLQEGVVLVDLDAVIRFANPAAAAICGYPHPAALINTPLHGHVTEPARTSFTDRMTQIRAAGWSGELELQQMDGHSVPVHITASPVRVHGVMIATVVVFTDLTQQKEMASRAATADKLATLGRLVAGAAHEINNPLAAVLANAELLQLAGVGAPRDTTDPLGVIVQETRRAGRIVRDLLSFARQRPVKRSLVDLRGLVSDVVAMRSRYQEASGLQVTVVVEDIAPIVEVDADQLKQVVLNLIVNAEDAVRDRPVRRLQVKVCRVASTALVIVDDSGPGIPESILERIFEPFFTTKPPGQGTGLGLSVSFGIVHEHCGRIWAERSPLGGARFVTQLPVATGGVMAPRDRQAVSPAAGASMRVLLVDDEQPILDVTQRILRRLGHTAEVARNGLEAEAWLRRDRFDVIICDLRMPEMSGPQLYARLQRDHRLAGVRFVVATGDIADANAHEFIRDSGVTVLLKPFELSSLLEVVAGPAGGVAERAA